jgi:hypothetical protein
MGSLLQSEADQVTTARTAVAYHEAGHACLPEPRKVPYLKFLCALGGTPFELFFLSTLGGAIIGRLGLSKIVRP